MKYFRLSFNTKWREDHQIDYDFSPECKWEIPTYICEKCENAVGGIGISYPSVDFDSIPGLKPYKFTKACARKKAENIVDWLSRSLPSGPQPELRGSFGPLRGRAKGSFDKKIIWPFIYVFALEKSILARLVEKGFKDLVGVKADIRLSKKDSQREYYEIEARKEVHIDYEKSIGKSPDICTKCGRIFSNVSGLFFLKPTESKLTSNVFRLIENPSVVVISESLANSLQDLELYDISLTEVFFS